MPAHKISLKSKAEVCEAVDSLLLSFGVPDDGPRAEASFSTRISHTLDDGERVDSPVPSADAETLWGRRRPKSR